MFLMRVHLDSVSESRSKKWKSEKSGKIGEQRVKTGKGGEDGKKGRTDEGRGERTERRREMRRRDETREERERRERARHRTVVLTKERAQGEKGKETLKTLEVECRGYGVRGGTDAEHLPERSGESGNGWNGERRGAIHAMLSREQDSAGQ